jgi:hypothetical protein
MTLSSFPVVHSQPQTCCSACCGPESFVSQMSDKLTIDTFSTLHPSSVGFFHFVCVTAGTILTSQDVSQHTPSILETCTCQMRINIHNEVPKHTEQCSLQWLREEICDHLSSLDNIQLSLPCWRFYLPQRNTGC